MAGIEIETGSDGGIGDFMGLAGLAADFSRFGLATGVALGFLVAFLLAFLLGLGEGDAEVRAGVGVGRALVAVARGVIVPAADGAAVGGLC